MRLAAKKLEAILWCGALFAGLLQAWSERYSIDPDGVNYLDISYAYLRHDWHNAINAYWSPLYSWLLAIVIGITHTPPKWESTVLHLVNFAIFVFALVCFAYFFRELTALCNEGRAAAEPQFVNAWAWVVLGYTLFAYGELELIDVGMDKPDMLVSALFFLATAILIRMRRSGTGWAKYAALGGVLAAGYLTKAVMFPLAFVFLFCSVFVAKERKRGVTRAAVALAVFLAIGGPWIAALSHAKGRITFGDAGRLNYIYYVDDLNGLPHLHGKILGAEGRLHVPCRNEAGNIEAAAERIPRMGKISEILFCDDKSTDGTAAEALRAQELHPQKNIRLLEGPGICKAENVWTGFRAARGDVLMILDADLSVMPEELPMFLCALVSREGEFVNGSRLVYPVQRHAMEFTNMIGNKFFAHIFSFLLDQRIKDTLCGTKVLWREDWERMEPNLGSWGIKDLWGDYELLFGASKLNLEIVELPVHYQERIFGVTKMSRVFSNGLRMLGICWHAWRQLGG